MKLFYPAVIAASLLAVCSMPGHASAQDELEPGDVPVVAAERDARIAMHRFTQCLVGREPETARAIVLMDPLTLGFSERVSSILDDRCVETRERDTQLTIQHIAVRYALADVLISREMDDVPGLDFSQVPALSRSGPPQINEARLPADEAQRTLILTANQRAFNAWLTDALGECVVRTRPGAVKSLLDTRIGSQTEREAIIPVEAAYARCLPEGFDLNLEVFDMRGGVAVNYYRLASAALESNE